LAVTVARTALVDEAEAGPAPSGQVSLSGSSVNRPEGLVNWYRWPASEGEVVDLDASPSNAPPHLGREIAFGSVSAAAWMIGE
jgi:hypothetical protein